jgi:hypothetical protein
VTEVRVVYPQVVMPTFAKTGGENRRRAKRKTTLAGVRGAETSPIAAPVD